MLTQILVGKPLPHGKADIEEIVVNAPDKIALDAIIETHARSGWKLRLRAHSADGEHSAKMFRSMA